MDEMNVMALTEFGAPEVLKPLKLPIPEPGEGEILVKVTCASFNPSDALVRKGVFKKIISLDSPHVPGVDFAGHIAAVGPGAMKFQVEDKVYGYSDIKRNGSYGEYIVLSEKDACKMPLNLSFEEAASTPLSYLTAYEALLKENTLKPGQSILIYGASGGVGQASIQLAKMRKAKIYAVAGTKSMVLLEDLGIYKALDYKKDSIHEEINEKMDLILNLAPIKKEEMVLLLPLLKDRGTFVSTTGVPDLPIGETYRVQSVQTRRSEENLSILTDLMNQGEIAPLKTTTWGITDAPLVHRLHEEGNLLGKAVFQISF